MKKEVAEKIAALMTAAFGLVAALAWNEAIQSVFKEGGPLFFLASSGPWAYAIIVTVIAVVATVWIGRISEKAK
jgi:hypothetical protein